MVSFPYQAISCEMKRHTIIFFIIILAAAVSAARASPGRVSIDYTLCPWGMTVTDENGRILLTTVPPEARSGDPLGRYMPIGFTTNIRTPEEEQKVTWHAYNFYRGYDLPWINAGCAVSLSTSGNISNFILATDAGSGISVSVEVLSPQVFRFSAFASPANGANRFGQSFVLAGDDHFFGFGERFNKIDQRGEKVFCEVEDGGLGLGPNAPPGPDNPWPNGPLQTYWPIPFFFSNRGYGLLLTTQFRSEFELGSVFNDAWRVEAWEPALSYYFFYGPEPLKIIELYTEITGRPPLAMPWVFAPWNDAVKGEDKVYKRADDLREYDIPSSAIWTEDLMWGTGGYDVDRELYPEAEEMIAYLHEKGYKFLGYHSPWVKTGTTDFSDGEANGYFITTSTGTTYHTISGRLQDTSLPDFTIPGAVQWYQGLLKRGVDLGLDGWMHDFGEFTPYDSWFENAVPGWAMRNLYPVLYQKAAYDLLRSLGREDEITFFVRSGYIGSQQYLTSAWSGDQNTDWEEYDGLPSEIPAGLNLGMSGMPYWGHDIAGYLFIVNPPSTKELFIRWTELGAVSPIMRTHHGNYEGMERNWTYDKDKETLSIYRRYAKLHQALFPYLFTYAHRAHATGAPIMRALVLQYPSDSRTYSIKDQFLLGEDILAAPVVTEGALDRRLYLPEGKWVDYWSNIEYQGGQNVAVDAPLDKLPLFVRAGAILPLLDESIDTMALSTDPSIVTYDSKKHILRLRIYTSGESSFQLYDGSVFQVYGQGDGFPGAPAWVRSESQGLLPLKSSEGGLDSCMNCWWFDREKGQLRVSVRAAEDSIITDHGKVLSLSSSSLVRDYIVTMDYLPREKAWHGEGCGCQQAPAGQSQALSLVFVVLFALRLFLRSAVRIRS